MIACKLEQMGERLALVLDEDQCQVLAIRVGETVRLERDGEGGLKITESWTEDPHARGRAFLKRLQRRADNRLV